MTTPLKGDRTGNPNPSAGGMNRMKGPAARSSGSGEANGSGSSGGKPLPAVYFGFLAVVVVMATGYGLLVDDAYRLVPEMTRETWRAQDAVTLSSVPVLLFAARRARSGSLRAHLLATGVLLWWTYCYAHLSIGTPLNPLFLAYVVILLLAGFATLDGLVRLDVDAVGPAFAGAPLRAAAWFLAVGALGMATLWLSEIVPAWPDDLPRNIHLSELPNPTWVLDLAWIIPTCLAAAVLLRRRHPAGPVVATVMLVALLILSLSMLLLTPFALAAGLHNEGEIRAQITVFTIVFSVLGLVEVLLLVNGSRRAGAVPAHWLRPGWWPGA